MRILFLITAFIVLILTNQKLIACTPIQQITEPLCQAAWNHPAFQGGGTGGLASTDYLLLNSGLGGSYYDSYCPSCGMQVYYPETNWKDVFGMGLQALPQALGAYFSYKNNKEHIGFMKDTAQFHYQYMDNTSERYYDACTSLGLVCESPFGGGGFGMGFGAGIGGAICHGAPATCGGNFSNGYMGAAIPFGPTGPMGNGPGILGGPFPPGGMPNCGGPGGYGPGCMGGNVPPAFGGPGGFSPGAGGGMPACSCIQMAGCPCAPGGGGSIYPPGSPIFGPPIAPVFGGPGDGMGCPNRPGCFGGNYPAYPNLQIPAVPPFGGRPFGAGYNRPAPWMTPNPLAMQAQMCGLQNLNHCGNPLLNGGMMGMDPRLGQILTSPNPMATAGGGMNDPLLRALLQSGAGNLGGLNPNISSAYAGQLEAQIAQQQAQVEARKRALDDYLKAQEAKTQQLKLVLQKVEEDNQRRKEAAEKLAKIQGDMNILIQEYLAAKQAALGLGTEYGSAVGLGAYDPSTVILMGDAGLSANLRSIKQ